MDKELLEVVLKKCARDSNVERVISVEGKPALAKGENYTSNIVRLWLRVVLGYGRLANRSLIMKQIITKQETGKLLAENNVTKSEAEIYSKIHKEMTFLMEEFEDSSDTLWCNLIHYDLKAAVIVLEDLKPLGYKLVPRQKGLDKEHAELALSGLGRYHAMAKVLEDRGLISKENYVKNHIINSESFVKSFFYPALLNTSKVIKERWDPCWKGVAEKLVIPYEKMAEKLKAIGELVDSEFNVLNHGDCWSNNMMFKYDWRDRPISVKFVDYQFPHYNSPCSDLTNFMYFSIQPSLRREKYNYFLQIYHDSLIRSLDQFGYGGAKPTLDEIKRSMDRMSFFGMNIFVCCYACLVCSATDAFDMEKILETKGAEGFNDDILCEPGMAERMGPDLIDFVEKHLNDLSINT